MAFDIFGFSFGRKDEGLPPDGGLTGSTPSTLSFTAPENYDGTQVLETGGFMSSVYDFGGSFMDENALVRQYRSMSLYPEVDMAIEDIITQAITYDKQNVSIRLDLSNTELSDNIKSKINLEFDRRIIIISNKIYLDRPRPLIELKRFHGFGILHYHMIVIYIQ
jgi:hypothetical protein